ncbi:MAG TPA: serine/threonine-protein kinase [Kofleriaceae bacterium]|jgi:serine/threonine-protein kinase|nr:serine/threonine-protein kinase [Kofleriaceae bacterium]
MSVQVTGIAAIGDVLAGKYRVDKILGIGGMGMVVAATHLELDQRVALKFMLPGSHESPETSARFLREARAAGRLNSEHVCRVMDVGRFDDGVPYIVMEYLKGEDLAAILRRRGPLRVSEAVDYILQGIEGIAEAHAHGIIHRDLKPENLFRHKRNDGGSIIKVLDFGISKIAMAAAATKTGDIMGSPAYMAPEQMDSSAKVDHRADVWSLGVVLYQLVAGKPPFHGDTLPLLCMHVVNDEPESMSAVREDLPDGFEAVVMRCLRKEPEDRYGDVGELAQALAPFGPKNATTSASRIRIVLRRERGSAAEISYGFTTVEPASLQDSAEAEASVAPEQVARPESTTFTDTAGQSIRTMRTDRHAWGLTGAVIAGLGLVALAIVVVWRSGRLDDLLSQSQESAAPSSVPSVPPPAPRPPAPIVEPIIEPSGGTHHEPAVPPPPLPVAETTDPRPVAAPSVDPRPNGNHRKRKRNRGPVRPVAQGSAGSGSAAAGSGSSAGSPTPTEEEEEDDDKWMHMTHDEKAP